MHKLLLVGIFAVVLPAGSFPLPDEPPEESGPTNVNTRFIVESVSVSGRGSPKLSDPLRSELRQVAGQNFDQTLLDRLADRIKNELHVPDVRMHVTKADTPDHVIVTFEIGVEREKRFDLDLARFLYHSTQGWSGQGHATININNNAFSFGMVSDGDQLSERYAGIQAGFERRHVGTDRLQLRFDFSSYHEQWNRASLLVAAPDDIYRTRTHFSPMATVLILDPLEVSFGVDFARYRLSLPVAKTESSNAVVSTLRYHQRWGSARKDHGEHDLRASYTLRAGTHFLEGDPVFSRHQTQARYRFRRGHQELSVGFLAGTISGRAPLFERFVLGMPRPCAAGTSSIWTRWARRMLRTVPSTTFTAVFWCCTTPGPRGIVRTSGSRNNRSAWVARKADFNWRWLSRSRPEPSIQCFTRG